MKHILVTIIISICALAMVDFSRAADPHVYIAWTYPSPPSDLAGFRLYVNGSQVEEFGVPTATSWSGPLILVDGNNTFEMTAYDAAGQESEKTAPFVLIYDSPPHGELTITDVYKTGP